MDQATIVALITVLPQLLLLAIALVLGAKYRKTLGAVLETRVAGLGFLGVHVDLRPVDVATAVQDRLASHHEQLAPAESTDPAGTAVADRAKRSARQIIGRTILWVDDHPEWLVTERRLVRRMGMFVEPADSNDNALHIVSQPDNGIDIIVSDIARDNGPSGLDLLKQLPKRHAPVIYYVSTLKEGVPPGAFGITNRPDDLLDLIIDALERLPPRP